MAFTDSGPEIVMLGRKSRDDEETRSLFELLQQVKPDCVPKEVLHSLFLTLEDDRQIKINTELVQTDIEYKNLTKYLEKMGIIENVTRIEVVVDLEKAKVLLEGTSNEFLDRIFR